MDSIQGLNGAFNSTEQVYGEVVMSEMMSPDFMIKAQAFIYMYNGVTLKELFSEEDFNLINSFTTENMYLDINALPFIKPAGLQTMIAQHIHSTYTTNYNIDEQLDLYFQNRALEEEKLVGGLEEVYYQLELFYNSIPLERQAEQLVCFVNEIEDSIEKIKKLNEAYLNQDIDYILKLSKETDGSPCDATTEEMVNLNQNRNKNWIEIMPDIMKERPTFFVVGALHLPGEEGTLNLLKQKGFEIEAVN